MAIMKRKKPAKKKSDGQKLYESLTDPVNEAANKLISEALVGARGEDIETYLAGVIGGFLRAYNRPLPPFVAKVTKILGIFSQVSPEVDKLFEKIAETQTNGKPLPQTIKKVAKAKPVSIAKGAPPISLILPRPSRKQKKEEPK